MNDITTRSSRLSISSSATRIHRHVTGSSSTDPSDTDSRLHEQLCAHAKALGGGVSPLPKRIVLREHIDLERAEAMMAVHTEVEQIIRQRWLLSHEQSGPEQSEHVDWAALRATIDIARTAGGALVVEYSHSEQSEGFGRMYAHVVLKVPPAAGHQLKLVPFVYMPREVRATLAARDYVDVDVVNCQPVLMRQRLEKVGIPCPLLARYVDNRDACLAELCTACDGCNRDAAKQLFLRIVYGGCIDAWARDHSINTECVPSWIQALSSELRHASSTLMSLPEMQDLRAYHARTHPRGDSESRRLASAMAIHMQSIESCCVRALVKAVVASRREVGGIIHDGVHVRTEPGDPDNDLLADLIRQWERFVEINTGFRVSLSVKHFDVPSCILRADSSPLIGRSAHEDIIGWKDGRRYLSYDAMKSCWERNAFKIEDNGNYCVIDNGDGERRIYSERTLHDSKRHLHYYECINDKLVAKRFITRWIDDVNIRVYNTIVLCPPPMTPPCSSFNIWAPFASSTPPEQDTAGDAAFSDSESVSFVEEFVHVLCGRNDAVTKYVLDWMAHIFQQPGVKPGVALLLKGEQGVGKNRFTDLLRAMVGSTKFLQTANPANVLYGRFTRLREGRILIVVNEVHGADSFANSELIKDMITCDDFISEGKGTNPYPVSCFSRFVFTTNVANCMRVTSDSRRFEIIETSSELKGNSDFFDHLSAIINSRRACHAIYQSLMARPITGVNWVNDRPITDYYLPMVQQSMPPEYRFLKATLLEAFEECKHMLPEDQVLSISLSLLFENLKTWLVKSSNTGRSAYEISNAKFGCRISELIVKPGPGSMTTKTLAMSGISKKHSKTGNSYVFNLPVVLREMVRVKWLSDADVPRGLPLNP